MKPLPLIFLLLCCSLIFSCKKKGEDWTEVKGTIFDNNTQLPMPNTDVYLNEVKKIKHFDIVMGMSEKYERTLLRQTTTDVNGFFDLGAFETKRDDNYQYDVNDNKSINKGSNNNVFIQVLGWIHNRVNFLPPPPYNTGDSLVVNFTCRDYPSNKH